MAKIGARRKDSTAFCTWSGSIALASCTYTINLWSQTHTHIHTCMVVCTHTLDALRIKTHYSICAAYWKHSSRWIVSLSSCDFYIIQIICCCCASNNKGEHKIKEKIARQHRADSFSTAEFNPDHRYLLLFRRIVVRAWLRGIVKVWREKRKETKHSRIKYVLSQ